MLSRQTKQYVYVFITHQMAHNIHITIIVLLSALVLFGPPTIHTVLNQAIIGGFYYPFYRLKAGWELLLTEAETNAKLQQSLIEASLKISLYEEALRENARLRAALGFEPPPGYHLVPAKVISVSEYQLPVSVIGLFIVQKPGLFVPVYEPVPTPVQ